MLPAKIEESRPTMEAVQELFDRWREKRKHRDPIPPALWEAALSLTASHSVYRIAKRLRLHYINLKARAEGRTAVIKDKGVPTFVELGPLTSTIELTKPTGERMTITGGCNVAELVRVFLG
jgi:hypothetical protein